MEKKIKAFCIQRTYYPKAKGKKYHFLTQENI